MSHRFKTSKYKNAAPKISKHDAWIRDVVIGSYSSYGSLIKSSAAFAAFNVNATGSQLGVVALETSTERISETGISILNAHSDLVTDLDFSPFEDGLLATCSADSTVKIWSITPNNLNDLSTLSPECVTSSKQKRVEVVNFNPTVEFLVTFTSQGSLTLWDILYNKELYHDNSMHDDIIMSVSWSANGNLLATSAKDKKVRIIDVRANRIVNSASSHENNRDSRVVWLGDTPYILTTGFDSMRTRQLHIRDTRNFNTPIKTLGFDSSTGVLMPIYDPDTKMLFIAGRGDTAISYLEFSESDPYLTEGYRYHGEQTKGVCIVPKRAVRVMETEVNRIVQLTSNSVVCIPYHVPRKTYVDFHADLYPDTRGTDTCGVASLYMEGSDGVVLSTSLNPNTYPTPGDRSSLIVFKKTIAERRKERQDKMTTFNEHDTKFKKIVPEPRPRKKSSSFSSSDEVLDGNSPGSNSPPLTSATAPVPKSRAKNNGSTIPFLRTPSSFISNRNAANFSRSMSTGEAEPSSLEEPTSLPASVELQTDNINNTQANGTKNGNSNATSTKVVAQVHEESEKNGNNIPAHSLKNVKKEEPEKNGSIVAATKAKLAETENEKNGSSSAVAPIPKPERKVTPPSKVQLAQQKQKEPSPPASAKSMAKRIDTVFGQVSKYRNFKAAAVHKKFHIENLRNISTTGPSESELIQANAERVAVPLNTPGGKIAIYELNKPGRQPDGVISALVHGTKVMDFMFDPFDSHRLVVGCDDGRICIWNIPSGGLKEQTNQPEYTIAAHAEKVYFVKFHPLAKDILASGSYDLTVRIWNMQTLEEVILIQLSPEQIQMFSFCWSPCGSKFATACKDGKIRVYEPRSASEPIAEGKGPAGVRGGRVCWALEGKYLIVAGFDRSSERQILMYNSSDLTHVTTVSLDVSPSILVPFYDEDSSILLLSGRGDCTIFAFDVIEESPYLRQLSNHRCPGAHQGVAFLKKNACEVQNVEFARALRLTEVAVEPWAFIVPRVKSEFFQDDLFPPTKVLWEPSMTAEEWLTGANTEPSRVSLKPSNMKSVGEITCGTSSRAEQGDSHKISSGNGVISSGHSNNPSKTTTAPAAFIDKAAVKKQQEDIQQAIREKLPLNMKLEQDSMEGVDETEWNE